MRKTFLIFSLFVLLCLLLSCKNDDSADDPAPKTTFDIVVDAPVTVKAGEDQTVYVYKDVSVPETRYANKITFTVPAHITHVTVNRYDGSPVPTLDQPRIGSEDIEKEIPVALARRSQVFSFAPGIGLKLSANDKFDVGIRVINATATDITPVKSSIVFEAPATTVTHEAMPFVFYNLMVYMPSGATGVSTYTYQATEKMNVVMLTNFSSKYITDLKIHVIKASTQELVYTSTDWEDPLVKSFDAMVLNAGDKLKLEATYTNPTSHAISFGTSSEDDFTGVFGYYYRD